MTSQFRPNVSNMESEIRELLFEMNKVDRSIRYHKPIIVLAIQMLHDNYQNLTELVHINRAIDYPSMTLLEGMRFEVHRQIEEGLSLAKLD